MPMGTPTTPPARKGHSAGQRKPRRVVNTATSCPVSEPNTASTAATRGSMPQTQNDMATMLKAKPERPCTKPATAAPTTSNHSSGVMPHSLPRQARKLPFARDAAPFQPHLVGCSPLRDQPLRARDHHLRLCEAGLRRGGVDAALA
ncbi:hypothetical protein D9M68_901730 [compost metagenome]